MMEFRYSSPDGGKRISYLTNSFEIIIMPKEIFILARLWQINSNAVLNFRVRKKGDLRIQQCH